MFDKPPLLFWLDLETSGLDPNKHRILEIASIITDFDLNTIAEGPDLIINQSDEVLKDMSDWCTTHHQLSGLIPAVRKSTISLSDAHLQTLNFVKQHCEEKNVFLAGNSVYFDLSFLNIYMSELASFLNYRIIDVSSLKELCRNWYPNLIRPSKQGKHRSLDDLYESIAELKFYRSNIFK